VDGRIFADGRKVVENLEVTMVEMVKMVKW
jgi:hypothetical protein